MSSIETYMKQNQDCKLPIDDIQHELECILNLDISADSPILTELTLNTLSDTIITKVLAFKLEQQINTVSFSQSFLINKNFALVYLDNRPSKKNFKYLFIIQGTSMQDIYTQVIS